MCQCASLTHHAVATNRRYSPDYKDVRKEEKVRKEAQLKMKKKLQKDANTVSIDDESFYDAIASCPHPRVTLSLEDRDRGSGESH